MNNSEFVALSKFSFSSGGFAFASVAGDSENVGIFVVNCGSVFDEAITGGCPGVDPATTTFFKRSILCIWCFCCGCRVGGLLFDSYYIIHII